jgi:hypothetical protein
MTGWAWQLPTWGYPALEIAHLLGIAMLLGNLMLLECRLFGLAARLPIDALAQATVSLAVVGFTLAAASGLAMFATQPLELLANRVFTLKMLVLLLAGCNAAWFHGRGSLRKLDGIGRAQLIVSASCWLLALSLGRWIGYA